MLCASMQCIALQLDGKIVILYLNFQSNIFHSFSVKMTSSCAVPAPVFSPFWPTPKVSLKHLYLIRIIFVYRGQLVIIRAPSHQANGWRATPCPTSPAARSLRTTSPCNNQIWSRPVAALQGLLENLPWRKYLHAFLPSWRFLKHLSR